MEKMKMHAPNLIRENIARIRELFPGCVTEAHGEAGCLKQAVAFVNWPGKCEALLTVSGNLPRQD